MFNYLSPSELCQIWMFSWKLHSSLSPIPNPSPSQKTCQEVAPPQEMLKIMPTGYLRPSPWTCHVMSLYFLPLRICLLSLVLLMWFHLDDHVSGET